MKAIKAKKTEKTPRAKAEELLERRAYVDQMANDLTSAVKRQLEPLNEEKEEIDKQLLDLATAEMKEWFPSGKKTAKFEFGELVFRASSKLVNEAGEPITPENTDLLKLAKKLPKCVGISPKLTELKPYIQNADLRHKLKDFDIDILVEDKFGVKSYPIE
jgi:hypothetical protein